MASMCNLSGALVLRGRKVPRVGEREGRGQEKETKGEGCGVTELVDVGIGACRAGVQEEVAEAPSCYTFLIFGERPYLI